MAALDNIYITPEHELLREQVARFIEREVEPHGAGWEEAGMVPREVLRRMGQAGLLGLMFEEAFGGGGADAMTNLVFAEALSQSTLAGFIIPVLVHTDMAGPHLHHAGNAAQKAKYMPGVTAGELITAVGITEPGAGSDARNIKTRAVRDGDDWIINGEKIFITGGNEADFVMVFAVTDPEKGSEGGITCFLVDRDMGWTSSPIATMGEWGPASLLFDNVRVPNENVLGEVGWGFKLAMQWIGNGRYLIPSGAIGGAERLLDMAIEHSKNRVSMGHAIADYQAIQWQIADSYVEIEQAKWLTLFAAWQLENGQDNRNSASVAKLAGTTMANRVVDRVLQIHGGMGYTKELPIERWYRSFRLLRIFEGTDEIQRRTIARNLIKGHTKVGVIGG